MAGAGLNAVELGELSGLGRAVIGRMVRGELKDVPPAYANAFIPHVAATMAQLLESQGYDMSVTPRDKDLAVIVDRWSQIPPRMRRGLLELVLQVSSPDEEEEAR